MREEGQKNEFRESACARARDHLRDSQHAGVARQYQVGRRCPANSGGPRPLTICAIPIGAPRRDQQDHVLLKAVPPRRHRQESIWVQTHSDRPCCFRLSCQLSSSIRRCWNFGTDSGIFLKVHPRQNKRQRRRRASRREPRQGVGHETSDAAPRTQRVDNPWQVKDGPVRQPVCALARKCTVKVMCDLSLEGFRV